MGRFAALWTALQPRQRLIAVLALGAIVAAVVGLAQAARSPSMATLYSGLEPIAAGEVTAAVEAMGVAVEVSGSTVMVPVAERDRIRLALAAQGLPRSGPSGYEILDGLDGFGTTSEMFEATYWRAKEGELARTILAAPGVRAARVHIANPVGRPFQRNAAPSASVTVTMGFGALDPKMAEAIRFMVASAVQGLQPTNVAVIDAANGAVLRMGESADAMDAQLPGSTREQALRGEIERLLAARVGEGRAIVSVAVDTTMETETVRERLIDPSSRVAISTDTRDVEENASGTGFGGAATVASNLPVPGGGEDAEAKRSRTESEERVNYEISETTRERVRRTGDINRITVAVLVDGITTAGPDGERVWTPRPEAEIEQLRELVRSAIGYNPERGDQVTVETLEFVSREQGGTLAEAGIGGFLERHFMSILQIGALAAVALGLAIFVLRPLMTAAAAAAPAAAQATQAIEFSHADDGRHDAEFDDPLTLLRDVFAEKRADSANVLRAWLERDAAEDRDGEEADAEGAR